MLIERFLQQRAVADALDPGQHVLEAEFSVEELAEMLGDELDLSLWKAPR